VTLLAGDLTTVDRLRTWLANPPTLPSAILTQLIGSSTAMIYAKLNRARTYSRTFTRTFDGLGGMQILLPDYPVTNVISVQVGQAVVPQRVIPANGQPQPPNTSVGYGYSFVPWSGNLPGEPAMLDFVNGVFWNGAQNITIQYVAGYLIANEAATVPTSAPYQVQVEMPLGIWCRDNGVTYANGAAMTPVLVAPAQGQYIPPTDASYGVYTFSSADSGASVLISYSFVPADLEEACCQQVAERLSYRDRIGVISKALGGQETVRFMRGGGGSKPSVLSPEVEGLIQPYMSVIPPTLGSPV
jgi:hypothetical protein